MIQGILILAHKNFIQLYHLIEYFSSECYVFIHIDKKAKFLDFELQKLRELPQVKGIYQKYSVHWAGFSILKSELYLLSRAMEYPEIGYFHLLSGQDYPIKPLKDFISFFSSTQKEYIHFTHLPNIKWESNTYKRFDYFFPYDYLERTDEAKVKVLNFIKWQDKLKIRRRIPRQFEHLYGGSAWFSITRLGATTLLTYTKRHPSFYRRLKFTFCPEETYVTTVLVNLIESNRIENNNYRFIRWHYENGCSPANLGSEHIHFLHESTAFFARKFESPISERLIRIIDDYLIEDTSIEQMPTGGWKYDGLLKYKLDYKLVRLIYNCYKMIGAKTLLDFGCGAGHYVASFRRLSIPAMGYDANPFTPKLSSILLDDCSHPCEVADLTDVFDIEEPFDITICIDVLQYIPDNLLKRAVHNLVLLTRKMLIIKTTIDKDNNLLSMFENMGMVCNRLMTKYAQRNIDKVYILEVP